MARDIYQSAMVDGNGRVVDEGTVTVYLAGTTTLATIYAAESGGSAISGSAITTDTDGGFSFWVDSGDYAYTQRFKITRTKTGYVGDTWDNIAILDISTIVTAYIATLLDDPDAATARATLDVDQAGNITDATTITFTIGSTEQLNITNGVFAPTTDNDIDIGTATREIKNIYVDGVAYIDEYNITGAYDASMPTNGVGADAKFMLGDSNTIIWMYLNTAPSGWKVLATGADTSLAVGGGAQGYTGNGGTQSDAAVPADWEVSGLTADAHTHTIEGFATGAVDTARWILHAQYTVSSAASADGVTSDATWRPSASVGKLFQLDTA